MGALCCRGGGGEGDEPRSSSGGASRHRRRSHSKKTHHAENASHAVVAADYDTASALVAPASGRAAAGLHALAPPPSPRRASKLSSAAPAPHSALAAAQKPFLVASGGAGALPSPRGGATLSRSESGVDVFHDAQESFDERDASSLAAAPFAFARHALCVEPPRTGHVCAGGGEAVLEVITATSAAMTAAAAGEDGEGAEQGKSAEVQEIEALGKEFGQDFWAGKGSLAGRGLKTLQALRHLKDVDLSRFGGVRRAHRCVAFIPRAQTFFWQGPPSALTRRRRARAAQVPISQHLPVSGSQARARAAGRRAARSNRVRKMLNTLNFMTKPSRMRAIRAMCALNPCARVVRAL
jgi:hypothetical protein